MKRFYLIFECFYFLQFLRNFLKSTQFNVRFTCVPPLRVRCAFGDDDAGTSRSARTRTMTQPFASNSLPIFIGCRSDASRCAAGSHLILHLMLVIGQLVTWKAGSLLAHIRGRQPIPFLLATRRPTEGRLSDKEKARDKSPPVLLAPSISFNHVFSLSFFLSRSLCASVHVCTYICVKCQSYLFFS